MKFKIKGKLMPVEAERIDVAAFHTAAGIALDEGQLLPIGVFSELCRIAELRLLHGDISTKDLAILWLQHRLDVVNRPIYGCDNEISQAEEKMQNLEKRPCIGPDIW